MFQLKGNGNSFFINFSTNTISNGIRNSTEKDDCEEITLLIIYFKACKRSLGHFGWFQN